MNIVRRVGLLLFGALLSASLWALAIDVSASKIVGNSTELKSLVAKSGIYNSVASGLLDQTKSQSGGYGDLTLTDPLVSKAAEDAFGPVLIQTNVEKFIDGTYAWLNGKTAQPSFEIDLTSAKSTFADGVATAAKQKAATLPTCTTSSASSSFDPFSATCLPKGTTADMAATQAKSTILYGNGFLDNPVIKASDVKDSNSGQNFFEKNNKIPQYFQDSKKAPIALGVLALIFALIIMVQKDTRRKGIRSVSTTILGIGIVLLIFATLFDKSLNDSILKSIKIDNNAVLQSNIRTLVQDIFNKLSNSLYLIGGIYAGLGVAGILGTIFVGKGKTKTKPVNKDAEVKIDLPEDKEMKDEDEHVQEAEEEKIEESSQPKSEIEKPTPKSKPIRVIKIQ